MTYSIDSYLGHFGGFPDWKGKTHKMKKMCLVDMLGEHGLRFFHFQSGNASKFQKTEFYSKVLYFGHQGWTKLYFVHFWTHFSHFGWFPDWKRKNNTKVKSFVLLICLGSIAFVFSFSVRKCFKISKTDFYSKVSYFGHQGWKKLYLDHFWTDFCHFGGFPFNKVSKDNQEPLNKC